MATALSTPTPSCLDDEAIAAAIEGGLATFAHTGTEAHLADCGFCRERLTELARGDADESERYLSLVGDDSGTGRAPPAADAAAAALVPGATLGRYVILARVGAGGMGVVYSAYDPELDRKIAIKVIRRDTVGPLDDGASQLRREARAMARLTHPNVVRVYDVGAQGGLVYIAMEFVVGADLDRVMRERKPTWRAALELCLAAGRGLAAAHEAGLVHRDVKPSNILCADDGHVLVADFGLTALGRGRREPSNAGSAMSVAHGSGTASDSPLGGTPGFAAPEQLAGEVCDARSDQYSYCATVARCLGQGAPPAVARVLARGMSPAPEQRFVSLAALLQALSRAAHRRRRIQLVVGAVAMLGLATIAAAGYVTRDDPSAMCEASARRFTSLWDTPQRNRVLAALSPADRARADFFIAAVDSRAASLRQAEGHACQASRIERVITPSAYDRQLFCLSAEAAKLEAIIAMAAAGGAMDAALRALDDVGGGDACNLGDGLLNIAPPPTDGKSKADMAEVQRLLGESNALGDAGRHEQELERARTAVTLADRIGYAPLSAAASIAEARALDELDRNEEMYRAAERARDHAIAGHDDGRLVGALLILSNISIALDRLDQAKAHLSTATAIAHARAIKPRNRLDLHTVAADLATIRDAGDLTLAFAELDAATRELPNLHDPRERELAELRIAQQRGGALAKAGKPTEAIAALLRATELIERHYGETYSGVATQYINVASMQVQVGHLAEAQALLGRALRVLERPDAVKDELVRAWQLDGMIKRASGDTEQALASYARALEVARPLLGDDHRRVWSIRNSIAIAWSALDRWADAAKFYDEYLAWARHKLGETSGEARNARLNLADAITSGRLSSDYARGRQLLAEALAMTPATSTVRVNVMFAEGNLSFAEGKFALAAKQLHNAYAVADQLKGVPASLKAPLLLRQAEALWEAKQRRAALRAAEEALAIFRTLPQQSKVEEITAWIAARKR